MNHWISLSVLLLIFLCVLVYLIYNRDGVFSTSNAPEEGRITFVSRGYMGNIIDNSFYFLRMTQADLLARNIGSPQGYIKLYKESLQDFSVTEKKKLHDLIHEIENHTRKFDRLHAIPWKFAKIHTNIEKGYPHTLGDVIVLSKAFFEMPGDQQIMILLHEKIHVYQRMFPLQTEKLITDFWEFKVVDKLENFPLARNNPDINNFIYALNDKKIIQLYKGNAPKDISDSEAVVIDNEGSTETIDVRTLGLPHVVTQIEHPYEIMGTLLPHIIISKYKDDTTFTNNTIKWMRSVM